MFNQSLIEHYSKEDILQTAAHLVAESSERKYGSLDSPQQFRQFLSYAISFKEHEVFVAIYLDTQHQVIEVVEEFRGTVDCASVYPREIVKGALKYNASAVIFAHNHPSGDATPSTADRRLTDRLKDALNLIDVRVLDHFVVGTDEVVSFAERGLL